MTATTTTIIYSIYNFQSSSRSAIRCPYSVHHFVTGYGHKINDTVLLYEIRVFHCSQHRSALTPVQSSIPDIDSPYAMTKRSRARPISLQLSDVDQSLPLLLQLAPPAAGSRPPASNGRLSPRYSLPVLVKIPPGILGMVDSGDSPQNLGLVQLLSYVP